MNKPRPIHPRRSCPRPNRFGGTAIRLLKRLKPHRALTAMVITLALTGAAIGAIAPRILGHATDLLFDGVIGRQLPASISKEQAIAAAHARGDNTFAQLLSGMNVTPGVGIDFAAIGRTLLLALGTFVVGGLLVWGQDRLLTVVIQRMMVALRTDVEDKLHRLPLSYIDSRRRGELLSRVTNDVDNVQAALTTSVSALPTTLLTVLAVLVMMLTVSLLLAAVVVVTVPTSVLATRLIARRSKRLNSAHAANTGRLTAHLEEMYSGLELVQIFGRRPHLRQQFVELSEQVYSSGVGAFFASRTAWPVTTFIGNLSYMAVAVFGGLQIATGQVSLGTIQAFIQYVRQLNQPMGGFAIAYGSLQSAIASAERIFELLDAPEQEPDPGQSFPAVAGRDCTGRVEFEHVSFGYQGENRVIKDLSLVAAPGSTVAIVGPTGAGKSTLVNLLMRFYEVDGGRILVDAVDIAAVDRGALRSRIGMVLQDTWLFAGTIADNIGYGRPGATRAEIIEAATAANLDEFVSSLPDGFDTWISENGSSLSAGQKQLITIARAFLARPQLLILDEATSSVDARSEALIQQAMSKLRRGCTCFVIAHRLSTIRGADMILVMEAGRIVEQGNHDELVARRGTYYAMTQVCGAWQQSNTFEPHDLPRRHARAGEPRHRSDMRPMRGPAPETYNWHHSGGEERRRQLRSTIRHAGVRAPAATSGRIRGPSPRISRAQPASMQRRRVPASLTVAGPTHICAAATTASRAGVSGLCCSWIWFRLVGAGFQTRWV